ncbi:hypothetical protein ROZALSC1DRAFT_26076 [Rozella allomycis CSF55]|uniref:Uncharacterized protein n=1 Tax=Rozella allomycis (strain CSF55) TaxID=988480 RepID=A0A4P9Y9N1_ROZAC|nr:hypothetical protein ROZALSC1DRAFT_26076 [Rozella allomycis CSF55]
MPIDLTSYWSEFNLDNIKSIQPTVSIQQDTARLRLLNSMLEEIVTSGEAWKGINSNKIYNALKTDEAQDEDSKLVRSHFASGQLEDTLSKLLQEFEVLAKFHEEAMKIGQIMSQGETMPNQPVEEEEDFDKMDW